MRKISVKTKWYVLFSIGVLFIAFFLIPSMDVGVAALAVVLVAIVFLIFAIFLSGNKNDNPAADTEASFDSKPIESASERTQQPQHTPSLKELLQIERVDIGLLFEAALKEFGSAIESILRPAMHGIEGSEEWNTASCFVADTCALIRSFANSCGGLTSSDAELCARVIRKLRPSECYFWDTEQGLEFLQRSEGKEVLYTPMTLEGMRRYDWENKTEETATLAHLYARSVSEIAEGHPDSLGKNFAFVAYIALFGKFVPGSSEAKESSVTREISDAFRTLGVHEGCSDLELKAAYQRKVAQWHPDRLDNMAPELREFATREMQKINEAWDFLKRTKKAMETN